MLDMDETLTTTASSGVYMDIGSGVVYKEKLD